MSCDLWVAETQPRDRKGAHGWRRTAGKNSLQLQHRKTTIYWSYNVCSRVEWRALGCTALKPQPQRPAPSLFPSSHRFSQGLVNGCFPLPFLHLAAPGPAEFQQTMIFDIQTANSQGPCNLAYPWEYEICLPWEHAAEDALLEVLRFSRALSTLGMCPHIP